MFYRESRTRVGSKVVVCIDLMESEEGGDEDVGIN